MTIEQRRELLKAVRLIQDDLCVTPGVTTDIRTRWFEGDEQFSIELVVAKGSAREEVWFYDHDDYEECERKLEYFTKKLPILLSM